MNGFNGQNGGGGCNFFMPNGSGVNSMFPGAGGNGGGGPGCGMMNPMGGGMGGNGMGGNGGQPRCNMAAMNNTNGFWAPHSNMMQPRPGGGSQCGGYGGGQRF